MLRPLYKACCSEVKKRAQCASRTSNFLNVFPVCRKSTLLPPLPKVSEDDLLEKFLKGSGPGGQKINKTSSAVQLTHLPTGIVVKCQETRSREQNRKLARRALAEKLDGIEKGDESRAAIKQERQRKKKASAQKKKNRKYRGLADEQLQIESDVSEVESRPKTPEKRSAPGTTNSIPHKGSAYDNNNQSKI